MIGTTSTRDDESRSTDTLGSPRFVLAPMVGQSELAWRLLARNHGAQLCFTPMLHAGLFYRDSRYRQQALDPGTGGENDRPLVLQFCANDPLTFTGAGKLAQHCCDAVDLNLGCPQMIARRVSLAANELEVPVSCKVRIFADIRRTVEYACMLEKAGCKLLVVHGRTREQKGHEMGLASWKHISAVRQAVSIPVVANGNVQSLTDAECCLRETGAHGVMSADGHLHNPAIFEGRSPPVWEISTEYLELAQQHSIGCSSVRAHLFRLWHKSLPLNPDLREELATARSVTDMADIDARLAARCQLEAKCQGNTNTHHWLCQPHFRNQIHEIEEVHFNIDHQRHGDEGKEGNGDKMLKEMSDEKLPLSEKLIQV
uniref:tRNA-dihydrouridine(16/17) synthase [NAD(P)(+)]-like isoform X2 n=1 Tax=Myxine glutinosa TaxID=7769 RepID=UPI00358DFB8D